jgi:predicted AlkP superfamily phosphohydrolase/phosphomutase
MRLPNPPRLSDWSLRHVPTLWDIVSAAGKGVLAINVPLTYPAREVNGAMISGFPVLARQQDWIFPQELRARLCQLGLHHVQELNPDTFRLRLGALDEDEFLSHASQSIQKTLAVTQHCMKNYHWDLLVTVFVATDRVQHLFWHYMDVAHPKHKAVPSEKHKNAIIRIYEEVDRAIGALACALDEDTYLFVISDHGFGPLYGSFLINSWLMELGLLKLKRRSRPSTIGLGITRSLDKPFVAQLSRLMDKIGLLGFVRRALPAWLGSGGAVLGIRELFDSIDLEATQALALSNGKIYINARREEEKEIVAQSIRDELLQLTDPLSGHHLDVQILTKRELYGDSCSGGPDLYVVIENYKYSVSSKIVPGRLWEVPASVSGAHREEGILLMKGPPAAQTVLWENVHIWDLAPTILSALEIPVPAKIQGKALAGIPTVI